TPPLLAVLAALAVLAGITAAALRSARRLPAVTVGWLWFGITLLPVVGLVQVGSQAMADRYMYLPLVGLAILVAWGAPALLARLGLGSGPTRTLLAIAACFAVAGLVVGTRLQLRHWRDSEALMRHALVVTEANFIAHAHLGAALRAQGRAEEAAAAWRESARLRPGYATVANNLAWLLATHRDPRVRAPGEAVVPAERAAAGAGEDPAVLDTLAAAYAAAGRFEEALASTQRAAHAAREQGRPELAQAIERRRDLYRRGGPWVER
ncbi:MAG: hypothetical protein ACR2P8_08730, partial [Myxococcota bacterium]